MRHHGFRTLWTRYQVKRSQLLMSSAFVSPRTGNTLFRYRHFASFYYLFGNFSMIELNLSQEMMRKSLNMYLTFSLDFIPSIYHVAFLSVGPELPSEDPSVFHHCTCIPASLSALHISGTSPRNPPDITVSWESLGEFPAK